MHSPDDAITEGPRPAVAAPTRGALALGLVGALGEALLAQLVSGADFSHVHVGVTSSAGLVASRFRPWKVGEGVILADDAFVAVAGEETPVAGSPIARYGQAQLLDAARIARGCGVSRLTVIAPLAALKQTDAAARALDPQTGLALRELGFERVLIVWPTEADAAAARGLRGMVGTIGRMLPDALLPGHARELSARSAALAITQASRTAPSGFTRLGARELYRILDTPRPERRAD